MRHGAGLFLVVAVVVVIVAMGLGGCGKGRIAEGSVEVCFVDSIEQGAEIEHTSVRVARADERGDDPCASSAVHAELIDDAGVHFWVGIDVEGPGVEVPADLFDRVDNATVRYATDDGFTSSLQVMNGAVPLLVAQVDAPLRGEHGDLQLVEGGSTTLPTTGFCGEKLHGTSLNVRDDSGFTDVQGGDRVDLVINDVDIEAFFVSAYVIEGSCGGEITEGTIVTWAAFQR